MPKITMKPRGESPPKKTPSGPLIFPRGMSNSELMLYLKGGRKIMGITSGGVRGYAQWAVENGMPEKAMTRVELEVLLARSGYDPTLAKGIGYEPPPREKKES